MRFRTFSVVALAFALASCATVFRGSTDQVQFDSEPTGAIVRSTIVPPCGNAPCASATAQGAADGAPYGQSDLQVPPEPGPACTTPCMAEVPRNRELLVTFSKAGYLDLTVPLKTKVAGAGAAGMAGNVVLGGAVGLVVDTASGAALDHYPNPLKVVLQPVPDVKPTKPSKRKTASKPKAIQ